MYADNFLMPQFPYLKNKGWGMNLCSSMGEKTSTIIMTHISREIQVMLKLIWSTRLQAPTNTVWIEFYLLKLFL